MATLRRAYAVLHIKAADAPARTIRGVASTPEPDRMGDVIEPLGITFTNPVPLLLYHNTQKPVGLVRFARPTKDGLAFEADLPSIAEAGALRDRIEEAWQSVTSGLLAGVSIGFRALEESFDNVTGGFRFLKTEVLELSLVTIPANASATIHTIKSLDAGHRAALGRDGTRVGSSHPGATGTRTRSTPMTTSDQITALRGQLQTKHARMDELNALEAGDGLTLTDEQQTEFDGLTAEVSGLTTRLKRLEVMESSSALLATPANGSSLDLGSRSRGGPSRVVAVKDETPPGIGLARLVLCKMAAHLSGGSMSALEIAKQRYPHDERIPLVLKAAVAAGNTTDATWAGPLVYANQLATEFIEYLRPQTIVGRLNLRRVPFNVRITGQTSGASANWVGQGVPKPVTKFDTAATTLGFTKIACISVITEELARFSSPSAEALVRDELGRAIVAKMDVDFIDPAKAAVANVSPASILNGVTVTPATITDAASVRTALGDLLGVYLEANNPPQSAALIMPATTALNWSLMFNALGQPEFGSLSMGGGTIQGIPVIVSQHAVIGGNELVIMVNQSDIFLADDGGVTVDVSREASITMSSDPVADAATAAVVSMWQANMLALRAERFVNWAKRRAGAAQYISIDVTP